MAKKINPYKTLEDLALTLLSSDMVDEGVLLSEHLRNLREREERIGDKPVCPLCKAPLERVRYKGYYDTFDYWDCDCGGEVKPTRTERGGYG